jgi:hypothetical protein
MTYLIFLSVLVCLCTVSAASNHFLNKDLHLRFQLYGKEYNEEQVQDIQKNKEERGFVACAGQKHISDLIRTIYALRLTWRSNYPIAIMHCSELDESFMETIYTMDVFKNIQFVDICKSATNENVGVEGAVAVKRLRGYFCKAAALVLSPFEHSMLLDLDLVWFKNPDKMFSSPFYTKTGAFFFRDRWVSHTPSYNLTTMQPVGAVKTLLKNFELMNVTLNSTWVQEQYYANGINPFWKALIPYWPVGQSVPTTASFYQDSSIVVVQKSRHQGMMNVLKKLMLPFEGFNGDQDIYWIAATVAGEPFTFSPYGGGQYGDCYGFMLHMDPDDALGNTPEWPTPFYINSEYLVEDNEKLTTVGEYLKPTMMKANLITANKALPNDLPNWAKPHYAEKCSSEIAPFVPAYEVIHRHVLYHQWLTLTIRIKRDDTNITEAFEKGQQCLPVLTSSFDRLNELVHDPAVFHTEDCTFMGCPKFPFENLEKDPNKWLPGLGRICDPILYHRPHSNEDNQLALDHYAEIFRKPLPTINTPVFEKHQTIQCSYLGWDDHKYLLGEDNKFHEFPDEITMKKMFYDTGKNGNGLKKISAEECYRLAIGTPLPKMS